MAKSTTHIRKACEQLLDIPPHKITYLMGTNLLIGCFGSLSNYNIKRDSLSHRIFVEVIGVKLQGDEEVEYEFNEEEWEALENLKNYFD